MFNVESLKVTNGATIVGDAELAAVADFLASSPTGPSSYKREALLAGIGIEMARLGTRQYIIVLYQHELDWDGIIDSVYLLDSFNTLAEATAAADSIAYALLANQSSRPDANGKRWVVAREATSASWPSRSQSSTLDLLHERAFQLRASDYEAKSSSCKVYSLICDSIVSAHALASLGLRFELWCYFVSVGEAARQGLERPKPE